MPNPKKPTRLWQRTTNGIWYIRAEGARQISTGTRDRREAEKALARYIAESDRPIGESAPDEMTVSAALEIYANDRAASVADPGRIGYAMMPLVNILGPVPLARINGRACRQYQEARGALSPATVRRELGVLQAALNHCNREGYLDRIIRLTLPPKSEPRDRWLRPMEAARLLRAAWRNPKAQHLARFILIALYTGTRSEAILSLQYGPNVNGGWVDLDQGVMYRRGVGKLETKKRTPPIVIPKALLAHMRRWQRDGSRFVVHVEGCRVGRIKRAWDTAVRQAGIDPVRKHDLRHTAITWRMQAGMDLYAASGFFGVSIEELQRTYAHHNPEHQRMHVDSSERVRGFTAQVAQVEAV